VIAVKRLRNSDGAKIPLKKRSSAGKEPPRKLEIKRSRNLAEA
jgi:hypothetical protein